MSNSNWKNGATLNSAESINKALELIKKSGAVQVDFKFVDFPGMLQHISFPVSQISEETFSEGFKFDGSSIRGWKAINESDMNIVPDASSALVDPFMAGPTVSFFADIFEPLSQDIYERAPRNIAKKAEEYLKSTGLGDTAYFGPESEFFLFSDVRYGTGMNESYYHVDSPEALWNTGKTEIGGNKGYKIRNKEGYFPVPPTDTLQDIRTEMVQVMEKCGFIVEAHHHEVATGGQCEIDFRFDTLTTCADKLLFFKYIVRNVAAKHGLSATFMPKPVFGDNGSGMHVHQSIWKDGKPLFAGDKYAGLSEMALYYIGGLLKHAPALLAITNPTTNSYKRLVPGFEAPVNLAYSARNRSASIRIPVLKSPKAKRLEFRCPDSTANPYLAFSACLMAGIDGIKNKIHPGEPMEIDIYEASKEELKKVPSTPGSLEEALRALEADHKFLLEGGVFTEDVLQTHIKYKYDKEVNPMRLRPHPYEFNLYYDI
ncbi:MAG: type I glutamate--ammonia ligase [Chloroherpetonaceae bacterium]|nr:type I glutamate--ammonia ligase [Chloroherpetonaceae bacterium]